jgi:hypothetical protein
MLCNIHDPPPFRLPSSRCQCFECMGSPSCDRHRVLEVAADVPCGSRSMGRGPGCGAHAGLPRRTTHRGLRPSVPRPGAAPPPHRRMPMHLHTHGHSAYWHTIHVTLHTCIGSVSYIQRNHADSPRCPPHPTPILNMEHTPALHAPFSIRAQ